MTLGTPFQTPVKRKEQCANKKPSLGIRVPGQRADVRRPTDSQKRPSRESLARQVKRIPALGKFKHLSGNQQPKSLTKRTYLGDRDKALATFKPVVQPQETGLGSLYETTHRRVLAPPGRRTFSDAADWCRTRGKLSQAQLGMKGMTGRSQGLSEKLNGGRECVV